MNQLKATFEGLRIVLIGDAHEQPMLHLKIKPFNINIRDWTGDVRYPASLYWDFVLMIAVTVTCDNYTCNTHQLLESDEFALGALYVITTSAHSSLIYLIVIDPWTLSTTVSFPRCPLNCICLPISGFP